MGTRRKISYCPSGVDTKLNGVKKIKNANPINTPVARFTKDLYCSFILFLKLYKVFFLPGTLSPFSPSESTAIEDSTRSYNKKSLEKKLRTEYAGTV